MVEAAELEPEPGDIHQAGRIGGLPPAHRADERALDVQRVCTDGLGEDVLGEDVALLEQVGILALRVVVPWHVPRTRAGRGALDGLGATGQHNQAGQRGDETCDSSARPHLEFTIDWRVSSVATSHASGNGSWA